MKNNSFLTSISWTWVAICLLFLGVLYYITVHYFHKQTPIPQVCSGQKCFTVELARTVAEREKGLMYREAMSQDHGMLFVFKDVDFHNFRMKNTYIPLDILRIDDQYKIVRILTAQPCKGDPCEVYKPEVFANYVIEINAGIAAKYGIKEGDMIRFKNIK